MLQPGQPKRRRFILGSRKFRKAALGTLNDVELSNGSRPRRSASYPFFEEVLRSESPIPIHHPLQTRHPGIFPDLPEIGLIEPTPPGVGPNLELQSEDGDASMIGLPPTRQASGSTLNPGGYSYGTASSVLSSGGGWQAAIELTARRDNDLLEEWRGSMDVLLIFATLFGAIITAFLIETLKDLRGEEATAVILLAQISQKLGAAPSGTIVRAVEGVREPSSRTRRVNRLWFASLSLTIASAIFAMLAKQWIAEYSEGLSPENRRTSKDRIRRESLFREFRFAGLTRWYVPEIVGALPIVLHVALLLFGVGLVDFFWVLDRTTSYVIMAFTVSTYTLYSMFVITPAIYPGCPYKTPLSHLISNLARTTHCLLDSDFRKKDTDSDEFSPARKGLMHGFTANGALLEREKQAITADERQLQMQFLLRLKSSTLSDSVEHWVDDELSRLKSRRVTDGAAKPRRPITGRASGLPATHNATHEALGLESQRAPEKPQV